jgi:uncharacterized protein YbjT (DUF2867 family)
MLLVTGATGHVGKELVLQLLNLNQPVRVLVRDARKVAYLGNRVEVAVGDLDKPETLEPVMTGVRDMFLVTLGTPQQDMNAVEAARRARIQHIVKLSTLEASEAILQVGKWHREREKLIETSGIGWTFLRPGMFMTNLIEWWADSIKQQGAVYFPGGRGKVAPIDPYDVAGVATVALTQSGHIGRAYELTGSTLLNMGEMVQIIGTVLGKRLKYVSIPPLAAKLWMLNSGMDKTLVNALMEMLAALRKNKGAIVTDTVERVTGRPARPFEVWCREHIDAFREPVTSVQLQ